jgi:hypothetical protein
MSDMLKIVAGWKALDDLVASNRIATASDPTDMSKKIEALRKQFKEQSLQVSYESKQKLAGLLRETSHVLTDLIHAMNICGEDAGAMTKLQQQVGKVTRSLSFVGEDDANGDGIKDSVEDPGLGLKLGNDKTTNDSHDAFKSAVKSIKTDEKTDKTSEEGAKPVENPAPDVKKVKQEPEPEETEEDSDEETEGKERRQ